MAIQYTPIHPGEILEEEFLRPLGIRAAELARAIHVPPNQIIRLINDQASVTPDTAVRLARTLRITPEFWLNLQLRFDLDTAADAGRRLDEITSIVAA